MRSRWTPRAAATARAGPNFFQLDMSGGYRLGLRQTAHAGRSFDVFNVTNRANYANPTAIAA